MAARPLNPARKRLRALVPRKQKKRVARRSGGRGGGPSQLLTTGIWPGAARVRIAQWERRYRSRVLLPIGHMAYLLKTENIPSRRPRSAFLDGSAPGSYHPQAPV